MLNETSRRKLDHIRIAVEESVESEELNWFGFVKLIHQAAPSISLEEVDPSITFLRVKISFPLLIEAITGGHKVSYEINRTLAKIASEAKIPIGVGSQRAALEDSSLVRTYRIVRDEAPDVPVLANLGISHVCRKDGIELAKRAVDMIDADALAVHVNVLQELLQPEGDLEESSVIPFLADLKRELDVPVIVKEVGNGISGELASLLDLIGIEYIDVGGAGGTNWAKIEGLRRKDRSLSGDFVYWGIPTVVSIYEAANSVKRARIIGSGGIRSGVDMAKAIALGASMTGAARPFLEAVVRGGEADLRRKIRAFEESFKICLVLTDSRTVEELRLSKKAILTGKALEWMRSRGFS